LDSVADLRGLPARDVLFGFGFGFSFSATVHSPLVVMPDDAVPAGMTLRLLTVLIGTIVFPCIIDWLYRVESDR
jgi:hypothetical protein